MFVRGVRRAREVAERSRTEPFERRTEDVVVGHHVVEALVLGGLHPRPDRVGVGAAVGLREDHSEIHPPTIARWIRLSLEGRTALVTGASRGIGAATATALDRAGARVALSARDRDALDKVAADLAHDPVVLARGSRRCGRARRARGSPRSTRSASSTSS